MYITSDTDKSTKQVNNQNNPLDLLPYKRDKYLCQIKC